MNTMKPSRRPGEHGAQGAKLPELNEPYPCDDCELFAACSQRAQCCSAFACYVMGERWRDEPREPTGRMYGYVFGVAA